MASKSRSESRPGLVFFQVLRAVLLLLPSGLLLMASFRPMITQPWTLWLGILFQLLVCSLSLLSRRGREQPVGPSVITLYLIALGWLWWGTGTADDWYLHMARAILMVAPISVFALQTLTDSGAPILRQAQKLARQLADRKDWPTDLASCRSLPEVKALREALHLDATPALTLLQHPRAEVRVAALAALEFRKDWRAGQAEYVLQIAQTVQEPPVRAGALTALANLDDRPLVEALAQFLQDPAWEVRRAAAEAILWDSDHRWPWIRNAVRRALGDPALQNDGPLRHEGPLLSPEAINDLTGWATEKGILATRAALTLGHHFGRALSEHPEEKLLEAIHRQLGDPHAPPILRMELARILWDNHELEGPPLEQMLDPVNPAPLRLIAVEALLSQYRDREKPPEALATLNDLARLPNREIALATADLVQRRLGVDLGLVTGQPLPPLHSRQAAEVTRRVMKWAARDVEEEEPAHLQPVKEL